MDNASNAATMTIEEFQKLCSTRTAKRRNNRWNSLIPMAGNSIYTKIELYSIKVLVNNGW
jgi:Uma2 family endonuclease